MTRLKKEFEADGFFGIGVLRSEDSTNIGTLWRSAYILGASFLFTINRQYKKQSSDVFRVWSKIPLFHYDTFDDFTANLPYSTRIVGAEMVEGAAALSTFEHPGRAVYLLGSERTGLPPAILKACHATICLPGHFSLNVAVTGSIILYDRVSKIKTRLPESGPFKG